MDAEKDPNAKRKKKAKRKRLIWVLLPLVLVVGAFLLAPVFISSASGLKLILAQINDSVDGTVDIGDLSMSWWKGVEVKDLGFQDDHGRTSVAVKKITSKPHYGSLLFGSLSFGRTEIYEPKVRINLSGPPQPTVERPPESMEDKRAPAPIVPVERIDLLVHEGSFKITDGATQGVEISQIESHLNLQPTGQQTQFDARMKVAGQTQQGSVDVSGQIKPSKRNGWNFKGTSGTLTVKVNELDLGSLGPIFALAGVEVSTEGSVSAEIKSQIEDGQVQDLVGLVKGKNLDISGEVLKGDRLKSSVLDAGIELTQENEMIKVRKLGLDSDWADAELSGTIPTSFASLSELLTADSAYELKGSFELDLAQAMSQMPRTLGVKEGLKVTGGKISGKIETVGKGGTKELGATAKLEGLLGEVEGKRLSLSEPVTLDVRMASDKAGVNFEKLDVSASFAQIQCSGSSSRFKYTADVDLARFEAELGQFVGTGQYRMGGRVLSKGNVAVDKAKVQVAGDAMVKDFGLSSADGNSVFEPQAGIDFVLAVEREKGIVDINVIEARASFGQVIIQDAVLPLQEEPAGPLKLNVSAREIDLAKLVPFMVTFASFPKDMQLAGLAELQVFVSGKEGTYTVTTGASQINGLRLVSPGKEPFAQDKVMLVFDGDYTPARKNWAIRKFRLISEPDILIELVVDSKVKGDETEVQGEAKLNYDWGAVTVVASPFLPQGFSLTGEVDETIGFSSTYPVGEPNKLLANLSTEGKLGFDSAYYKGMKFSKTEAEIQIVKGLLTLSRFSSGVNNGVLKFAGQADLKIRPRILKTPGPIQIAKGIELNDELSRELLVYVNPIFANAFNVSGVGDFHCERLVLPLAGGDNKQIEVVGTFSADNLTLSLSDTFNQLLSLAGTGFRGQTIKVHPTRFVLRDGFVAYDDMQVDIGNSPINFRGKIGLDSSLDMTITLPYTLKGVTARADRGGVGKRISVPLKGTLQKPDLDLEKFLTDQAIQTGVELLFDKLLKK
jgi:hypothetical protein